GRALAGVASAAVDVSDGLLADLGQLCGASGVGAVVELERLPRHPAFERVAQGIALDPLEPLLAGGEAYELLFTAPPGADVEGVGVRVGHVVAAPGVTLTRGGAPVRFEASAGFQHFG